MTNPETQKADAPQTLTQEAPSLLDQIVNQTIATQDQRSEVRDELDVFVRSLHKKVLEGHEVDSKVMKHLDALIASIDEDVSRQLDQVMHNEHFLKLEGTWRGLQHLVKNTDTSDKLRIKVINVTKDELREDLVEALTFDQSSLFHKVYTDEYGQAGGQPFGLLVGDYDFSAAAPDVTLLKKIGEVAAAAHAPFISGLSPKMFRKDFETFADVDTTIDWSAALADGKTHAAWNSFRASEDSRYVGLTMPRVLARLPYGEDNPAKGFNYQEQVSGKDHKKYVWMNAAWAFATNVTRAYSIDGWLARIRGVTNGGKVDSLPVHQFTTDAGLKAVKCPTEILIPDRCENQLSSLGFLPLVNWKDTDYAAFLGAQSCQKPKEYVGRDAEFATSNAALSAKINYILCVSRFSHCLQAMVRTWIGGQYTKDKLQSDLNDWIRTYVATSLENLPEEDRGKYPLQDARIDVETIAGRPGWYRATAFLKPHLHLEGLNAAMSLVAEIPQPRAKA